MALSKNVPLELADEIAHWLPKVDLLSLRRVSKDMAGRCDRLVLKCIPTELHITLSVRWRSENILAIVQNPTWRNVIKTVTIYQDHSTKTALKLDALHGVYGFDRSHRAIRSVKRGRVKVYGEMLADQDNMIATSFNLQTMIEIFTNLRYTEGGLEIEVAVSRIPGSKTSDVLSKHMGQFWMAGPQDDGRPLRSVLTAIEHSGLRPTALEADLKDVGIEMELQVCDIMNIDP